MQISTVVQLLISYFVSVPAIAEILQVDHPNLFEIFSIIGCEEYVDVRTIE